MGRLAMRRSIYSLYESIWYSVFCIHLYLFVSLQQLCVIHRKAYTKSQTRKQTQWCLCNDLHMSCENHRRSAFFLVTGEVLQQQFAPARILNVWHFQDGSRYNVDIFQRFFCVRDSRLACQNFMFIACTIRELLTVFWGSTQCEHTMSTCAYRYHACYFCDVFPTSEAQCTTCTFIGPSRLSMQKAFNISSTD